MHAGQPFLDLQVGEMMGQRNERWRRQNEIDSHAFSFSYFGLFFFSLKKKKTIILPQVVENFYSCFVFQNLIFKGSWLAKFLFNTKKMILENKIIYMLHFNINSLVICSVQCLEEYV